VARADGYDWNFKEPVAGRVACANLISMVTGRRNLTVHGG